MHHIIRIILEHNKRKKTRQEIRTNFPILDVKIILNWCNFVETKEKFIFIWWTKAENVLIGKESSHRLIMNQHIWQCLDLSITSTATALIFWYRSCIDLLSTFEIKCLTIAHLLCRPCQNSPWRVLLNSSLVLCYK